MKQFASFKILPRVTRLEASFSCFMSPTGKKAEENSDGTQDDEATTRVSSPFILNLCLIRIFRTFFPLPLFNILKKQVRSNLLGSRTYFDQLETYTALQQHFGDVFLKQITAISCPIKNHAAASHLALLSTYLRQKRIIHSKCDYCCSRNLQCNTTHVLLKRQSDLIRLRLREEYILQMH